MPLWAALFLAALPLRAQTTGVDLSDQFPSSCRNQGQIGACHAFASVALLEAAIKRRGGGEVELSEADLFVRGGLLKRNYLRFKGEDYMIVWMEGGDPDEDIAQALKTGVAYRKTAPWDRFAAAFEFAKRKEEKAMKAECKRVDAETDDPECRRQTLAAFYRILNDGGPKAEAALLGPPEPLAKDRAEVLGKLAGLTPESKSVSTGDFEPVNIDYIADKTVCRAKGAKQTKEIVKDLEANTPVLISFFVDHLKGWDDKLRKDGGGSHCAVVYAYSTKGEGEAARVVFKVRNSWGKRFRLLDLENAPVTFDISEDQACAIMATTRLVP